MKLGVSLALPLLVVSSFSRADDGAIRNEIQATYQRAILGQMAAKTAADLDANERLIDTADWVSIVNDGPPQQWAEARRAAIASLGHPEEIAIRILKLRVSGDRAVVIARVGAAKDVNGGEDISRTILIRDTWIKTNAGWRRKVHEKPAPGKLEAELK